MNKLFIIIASVVFISCNKDGKTPPATAPDSLPAAAKPAAQADTATVLEMPATAPAEPIAAIRRRVEHINTATLDKKHFEFMCDEKMMVDYFYEDGEIVKIAIDFGTVGDVYAKEGYYYDKGKLVFIYEFTEGGPACEGCIKTHEYRSYVENDKTIKHLKDKTGHPCKKCAFGPSARQYTLLQATTQEQVKALLCR